MVIPVELIVVISAEHTIIRRVKKYEVVLRGIGFQKKFLKVIVVYVGVLKMFSYPLLLVVRKSLVKSFG